MIKKIIQSVLLPALILSITGCGTSQEGYQEARKAAWDFLVEKEWDEGIKENSWQSAEVSEITIDYSHHLINESYLEEQAFSVSFAGEENLVTGPPVVLVDPDTNKVVAYMPGE